MVDIRPLLGADVKTLSSSAPPLGDGVGLRPTVPSGTVGADLKTAAQIVNNWQAGQVLTGVVLDSPRAGQIGLLIEGQRFLAEARLPAGSAQAMPPGTPVRMEVTAKDAMVHLRLLDVARQDRLDQAIRELLPRMAEGSGQRGDAARLMAALSPALPGLRGGETRTGTALPILNLQAGAGQGVGAEEPGDAADPLTRAARQAVDNPGRQAGENLPRQAGEGLRPSPLARLLLDGQAATLGRPGAPITLPRVLTAPGTPAAGLSGTGAGLLVEEELNTASTRPPPGNEQGQTARTTVITPLLLARLGATLAALGQSPPGQSTPGTSGTGQPSAGPASGTSAAGSAQNPTRAADAAALANASSGASRAALLSGFGALPQTLKAAVEQVLLNAPRLEQLVQAQGVKQAVEDSGAFFERKLAEGQGPALERDHKTNLLRLMAAAQQSLRSLPEPGAPPLPAETGPEPPLDPRAAGSGAGAGSSAGTGPALAQGTNPSPNQGLGTGGSAHLAGGRPDPTVAANLLAAVEARESAREVSNSESTPVRQATEQIAHEAERSLDRLLFSQVRAASAQEQGQTQLVLQIPVQPSAPGHKESLTLKFEREPAKVPGGIQDWRVEIAFDLEPLGPIRASLRLEGADGLSTRLWADRDDAQQALASQLDLLNAALAHQGFAVKLLGVYPGAPPALAETAPPTGSRSGAGADALINLTV